MRAFQIAEPGGPDVLSYADRDEPTVGSGQLLVRVAFAGLNFTDVLARRGAPGYTARWPYVPGMEIGGTVEAVGEGVLGFAVGDTVVAFTPDGGGYAELAVADARLAAVVPAGVDLASATTIPVTWATAVGLVQRSHCGAGDSVLITSAGGGVAGALVSVLGRAGVRRIVGGVGSQDKAAQLPAVVVPVVRGDGFYERAVEAAGGPFDVILESIGGDVLRDAADYLAVGGRLVSYGGAAGQPDPDGVAFATLRMTNLMVSGFSILRLARTVPEWVSALIADALSAVQQGMEITAPVVVAWEQLAEAHIAQSEGRSAGKVVVAVG